MQVVGMREPACILVEGRTEIGVRAVPAVVEYVLELRQTSGTVAGEVDRVTRSPLPHLQGLRHRCDGEQHSDQRPCHQAGQDSESPCDPGVLGELAQRIPLRSGPLARRTRWLLP